MNSAARSNWFGLASVTCLLAGFAVQISGIDLYYEGSRRTAPLWWIVAQWGILVLATILAGLAVRFKRTGWFYVLPVTAVWMLALIARIH